MVRGLINMLALLGQNFIVFLSCFSSVLCHCQEPHERKLGYTIHTVNKNSRPFIKRKWDYAYDVPLLSSLHQIMSDKFILREVYPIIGVQLIHNALCNYTDPWWPSTKS